VAFLIKPGWFGRSGSGRYLVLPFRGTRSGRIEAEGTVCCQVVSQTRMSARGHTLEGVLALRQPHLRPNRIVLAKLRACTESCAWPVGSVVLGGCSATVALPHVHATGMQLRLGRPSAL
jgi:hypothetical protein